MNELITVRLTAFELRTLLWNADVGRVGLIECRDKGDTLMDYADLIDDVDSVMDKLYPLLPGDAAPRQPKR